MNQQPTRMKTTIVATTLIILFCQPTSTNAFLFFGPVQSRKYEFNALIPVVVEGVSPFENPSERYDYNHLPWPCQEKAEPVTEEVGSEFTGERAHTSPYKIYFRRKTDKKYLCKEAELSAEDVNKFIDAIKNHYEYEMRVDDLPVFGQVGLVQKDKDAQDGATSYFLLTHRHFHLTYNDDRVITCNISREVLSVQYAELRRDTPKKVHFSYEVEWSRTGVSYANRWNQQMHAYPTRYQVEAHWLWIMNSSLLVVLLTGLFSMILLRTLKNDVARYLQLDQIDQEDAAAARAEGLLEDDESGWKRIRFDVFRPPAYPLLLSSVVGVGAQLLMIAVFLLFLAVVGYFYPGNHGRIYVAMIFLYSLTAYVAGYVASAKMSEIATENDWMLTAGATAGLFAGPFLTVFAVVNSVAISYESTVALPFATILTCIIVWAFITFPLTAFGSYRGAKVEAEEYPCIVKRIPRPLPEDLPWYHNPVLQILTAGFLPFMSIYVELGTIFLSVWGHQAYTLFGILALTFVILLIVTSFAVILMCYFQLGAEDYRWWWMSIFRGGACGLFMYAYAWYYWVYQSHMSGALQGTMFFLYTLMISYAFSLMLGAVGHWASRWFVVKIYKAIKSD